MRRRAWARRAWVAGVVVAVASSHAAAQDQPNPEQLRRMYDETLGQLRAAQERRNELAARVRELETKLAEQDKVLGELRSRADTWAERTFSLRATHAAWRAFVDANPELLRTWERYLAGAGAVDAVTTENVLTLDAPAATTQPLTNVNDATAPTPAPTTAPAQ